jgi:hypothetical protein
VAGSRWSHVDDAIREAVAGRLRPSDVLRKIRAGTIDGVDGPTPIPERTFYGKWTRAKREQGRGGGAYTGPTVIQVLAVEIAHYDTGSDDPEQLAQASGLPLELVRECLALKTEAEAVGDGHTRACDLVVERRRAGEGAVR